jgi:hypothetical protein
MQPLSLIQTSLKYYLTQLVNVRKFPFKAGLRLEILIPPAPLKKGEPDSGSFVGWALPTN